MNQLRKNMKLVVGILLVACLIFGTLAIFIACDTTAAKEKVLSAVDTAQTFSVKDKDIDSISLTLCNDERTNFLTLKEITIYPDKTIKAISVWNGEEVVVYTDLSRAIVTIYYKV